MLVLAIEGLGAEELGYKLGFLRFLSLCSDKSDDIKLEPYEIYDQVACETCGKLFYNQKSLSDHIYDTHKVKAVFKYLVWQRKVSF